MSKHYECTTCLFEKRYLVRGHRSLIFTTPLASRGSLACLHFASVRTATRGERKMFLCRKLVGALKILIFFPVHFMFSVDIKVPCFVHIVHDISFSPLR